MQRRIQKPVKHLRWSILQNNYFSETVMQTQMFDRVLNTSLKCPWTSKKGMYIQVYRLIYDYLTIKNKEPYQQNIQLMEKSTVWYTARTDFCATSLQNLFTMICSTFQKTQLQLIMRKIPHLTVRRKLKNTLLKCLRFIMASFEVIWQQLHRSKQFKKALFDARKDKFKSENDEELFGIDIDSIFPSESHISNF